MKLYVIEGYDTGTESSCHFRVHAETRDEALALAKADHLARRCDWLEIVDVTDKGEIDEPGLVDVGPGPDIGVP